MTVSLVPPVSHPFSVLAECDSGSAFASRLCELALALGRAHGARVSVLRDGGLHVLCESGRGLALLRDELAVAAVQARAPSGEGLVSVVPLGRGVIELVGASEDGVAELSALAALVGLALEGVLARDERRGRGRVAEVVANLVRRIGGSLDLGEVLSATAESAARALNFDRAFVGLFLEIGMDHAKTGQVFTFGFDADFGEGIGVGPQSFERLVRRGEPILFDRARDAKTPLAQGLADLAPERCLIVPLAARGRPLGVLYVDTQRSGSPLSEDDVWLALALAEQASLAIDNARLYEEESRGRRSAEQLREVGSALSGSLKLADTLEKLLEHARRLFGCSACAVYELQPDARTLAIRSALGLTSEYVLRARAKVGTGVVGRAVEKGERVCVRDVKAEKVEGGSRYTRALLASGQYPYRGLVGLPLAARGKTFGGLSLYWEGPLTLDEQELSLLEVFAAQAALAIENARLYEEEVRREREAGVLLHLSRLLGTGRREGALREAVREVTFALNADRGFLALLDERGDVVELASHGVNVRAEDARRFLSGLGRGPKRLTRRQALNGAGSGLIVPIRSGDALLGLVYVDVMREEAPPERVLALARSVADQLALTTSRELLLAALEREEARYRLLAEGAHDLILACASGGTITYANPATKKLLGDVSGRHLRDLLGEEARLVFDRAWHDCLADPSKGVTCEVTAVGRRSAARLELRLSAVVRDREVLSVLLVARDLSEQLRLAEEIARRGEEAEAATRGQLELRSYLALFTQAQEEERKRISRELHDDTAQVLVAIGRRLDRLSKSLVGDTREHALDIRADLGAAIDSVRRFARNLRPSVLDDLGLLPALEWLAGQARTPSRLEVQGAERRLASSLELTIFRLVQEALTNVDKHARANSAAVRIAFEDGEVHVSVLDDGAGFDVSGAGDLASKGHLGLMGLRERVTLAGGRLDVTSAPGEGASLKFTFPA
ncbi:GAF domain-containing protein [Deinococcus yavapaiensis]|uniref:histidine kinase n=1 Tax=Deinococcus yavapaiensis KR-236 TaxID=694435 RepID=A0A318ST88_9DEIO|nr:GAF domain-containing protein [Deinococcus yavapaiensis]PYE56426.1 PAS domain S-box-containing protein [Deinococcus yavapaiensis KR-236]